MNKCIDISKILRANRARLKLTQEEMALMIGVKRSRYGSYEDGRASPKIALLVEISKQLGYETVDSFLKLSKPVWTSGNIEREYMLLPADKKMIVDFILKLK